jgi:hypothetical protein
MGLYLWGWLLRATTVLTESSLSRIKFSIVALKALLLIDCTSIELLLLKWSKDAPPNPFPFKKATACLGSLVTRTTQGVRYCSEGRN